jgi:hypothetical protein
MRTEQNMTIRAGVAGDAVRACTAAGEEYVCWTRMQAEAGQPLEAIVERKERERRVGQGTFLWGIGNAPALITRFLARTQAPVRAVFSIMKSKPKPMDAAPFRTIAWRGYIDAHGVERPLPSHVLVTSRGDNASGAKRVHYALMCCSEVPLVLRSGNRFDPGAFRNAGRNGARAGASQVTALLRRVKTDHSCGNYEANLTAWLTGSYWVRLTGPTELSPAKQAMIVDATCSDDADWLDVLAKVRDGPPSLAHLGGAPGSLI